MTDGSDLGPDDALSKLCFILSPDHEVTKAVGRMQAEVGSVMSEIADLKSERECILATRKFWIFSEREMIRRRDLPACRARAEERENYVIRLQDQVVRHQRKSEDAINLLRPVAEGNPDDAANICVEVYKLLSKEKL